MAPIADNDVVIVEAARSPLGRRNGGLATVHPVDLLGTVQRAVIERSGIDPALVGQVIGGCVSQVGEQTFNIARGAWLSAGLPLEVAGSTVDSQCGSSQQATNLAASLVKSGVVDVAIGCGVESMSPRAARRRDPRRVRALRSPLSYREHYELTSQFEGAERIADKWGITRADTDAFGLESQVRAQRAWAEGRFEREVRADRRARRRRRRQAHRHDAPRRARRRPPRDVARGARQAEAGRTRGRRAHRGLVVADHRRRGGGARHHCRSREGARACGPGAHRRPVPRRRRPGAHAHRPDRRDPPADGAHRPDHRRLRRRSRSTRRSRRWCSRGSAR